MAMRTFRTKDCTFVFNEDFTGDVHLVMPTDGVEINGLKLDDCRSAVVTVTVPFQVVKDFIFHYLQIQVKNAKNIEEALLEPFKE